MFCRSDLCRYNFYLTDIFARVHSLSCTYKYRDRSFNWDQDLKKIRIFGLCGILFFTVLRTKKKKNRGNRRFKQHEAARSYCDQFRVYGSACAIDTNRYRVSHSHAAVTVCDGACDFQIIYEFP